MRDYAKVFPQFWIGTTGKEIKKIGGTAQLVAMYLITSPHATMLGIYYLPLSFITHETGVPHKAALKAIQQLCNANFCTYDNDSEYVWIHNMAFYQIGGPLKPQDNRVKNINDLFYKLPKLPFLSRFYEKYHQFFCLETTSPLEGATNSLASQEQEQENEQKKPISSEKLKTQAIEILQFLNIKTGRVYRPVDTNLKLIMARLTSGATVMDCRQVIAKKTREWRSDTKMAEYLRPATLFNATKFEQYLGELVIPNQEQTNEI